MTITPQGLALLIFSSLILESVVGGDMSRQMVRDSICFWVTAASSDLELGIANSDSYPRRGAKTQMKNYKYSSIVFCVVGTALMLQGLRLVHGADRIAESGLWLLCFGTVSLMIGAQGLIRISKGRILLE